MPRWFWTVFAAAITACRASPPVPAGVRYPPHPTGFTFEAGSLIQGRAGQPDYSIEVVSSNAGGRQLWFGRLVQRDSAGHAHWLLLQSMTYPAVAQGQRLILGVCAIHGIRDDALIALAKDEDSDSLKSIVRAWRADRDKARIVPVSTAGIACENEGYGE